jgi:hypothetical protein
MPRRFLLALLLLAVLRGSAQVDTTALIERAHAEAQRMIAAFDAGEYDAFLDLTHPRIVDGSGGRERMKAMFRKGIGPGSQIISTTVQPARRVIIVADTLVQCAMDQRQVLSTDGIRYSSLGSLIGISYDRGRTWRFIALAKNSLRELRKHFPELSPDLDAWPQTEPLIIGR